MSDELQYSSDFWDAHLAVGERPTELQAKLDLVASLLLYLSVSFGQLLIYLFSSTNTQLKTRASRFLRYHKKATDPNHVFYPSTIYNLWHERWPKAQPHLHDNIIEPCARKIAVAEGDTIIKERAFQVKLSSLTIANMRKLLQPAALLRDLRLKAPFTFGYLYAFTTAPNKYRIQSGQSQGEDVFTEGPSDAAVDWTDDPNVENGQSGGARAWEKDFPGFSRNPLFAILVAVFICAFVRNRATNILAVPLGLFFKINGTSERVLLLLSNIALSVSSTSIERLKEQISKDAVHLAINLITGPSLFYIIFDNINLYLRKFQERITNRHSMIHATNVAVGSISEGDPVKVENLPSKLDLRGKRINANFVNDILPNKDDSAFCEKAFQGLIAELLVRYTPGSNNWEGRREMLDKIANTMPKDRPLAPEMSDMRPLGVFNVNEGSKKGIIKFLKELQEKSTLSESVWSGATRIMQGDWLTSSNLQTARRERVDDIDSMERLEYTEEISALWHFALNATHMIMRTHFGNAITDPASLAAHKGLLRRTWDAHKPNYAAAKALIRHSLIARLIHCVMTLQNIKTWSALKEWKPTYETIEAVAQNICSKFADKKEAERTQAARDDWLAHEILFIRDTLLFLLFEHAVAHADAGIVLRVLKYWALSFRGAGQHNYARECVEILVRWKYELTNELRKALERAWFVNRWGLPGRWIAADLFLEQCNFWVKCVFIAHGSGVTIEYIMTKGSACVEAFRDVSHLVANFFGDPDRRRRSKEVAFMEDLRVLVEEMVRRNAHVLSTEDHFVPEPTPKAKRGKKKSGRAAQPRSAVVDVMDSGAAIWAEGKFTSFIQKTTYDPASGYPPFTEEVESSAEHDRRLDSHTAFDNCYRNVIEASTYIDLHGDETDEGGITGALGGGGEYHTGEEEY
uniref:Sensor protein zRas n=1 Tax=Ganoderma boninense TaxID=34458 RepID=A0A5K1K5Y2_9APHY|nr:Sensor protein zRas [Ganoderma boninense]